jgi:hypothetical protein
MIPNTQPEVKLPTYRDTRTHRTVVADQPLESLLDVLSLRRRLALLGKEAAQLTLIQPNYDA